MTASADSPTRTFLNIYEHNNREIQSLLRLKVIGKKVIGTVRHATYTYHPICLSMYSDRMQERRNHGS